MADQHQPDMSNSLSPATLMKIVFGGNGHGLFVASNASCAAAFREGSNKDVSVHGPAADFPLFSKMTSFISRLEAFLFRQ